MNDPKMIKFLLNGSDIYFVAKAPEDITLKDLLDQTDRIKPFWCACGIKRCTENLPVELEIGVGYIRKCSNTVPCRID